MNNGGRNLSTRTFQDHRSAPSIPDNDPTPVVVKLQFPVDELLNLQAQRIPAPPIVTPRGMPRIMAASYVGCSPRKFDCMVENREMPVPRMIGVKKVWDRYELDEFFESLPKPESQENDWDES